MQNKPAHTPDSAHAAALAMGAPPAVADWVRATYAACLAAGYYVYDDGRPGLAYGVGNKLQRARRSNKERMFRSGRRHRVRCFLS